MSIFTDVRTSIAHHLTAAAEIIDHFGLSHDEPFDSTRDIHAHGIYDTTPVLVSPVGAIVMAYHAGATGWRVPRDWNDNDYAALAVFAQFLIRERAIGDHGSPADTINAWLGRGHTEATVLSAMGAAASAVRCADRDSKLLAAIS